MQRQRTCGGLVTFFVRAHVAGLLVGSQHGHDGSDEMQRRSGDGDGGDGGGDGNGVGEWGRRS